MKLTGWFDLLCQTTILSWQLRAGSCFCKLPTAIIWVKVAVAPQQELFYASILPINVAPVQSYTLTIA
jgi:hypothetical protein